MKEGAIHITLTKQGWCLITKTNHDSPSQPPTLEKRGISFTIRPGGEGVVGGTIHSLQTSTKLPHKAMPAKENDQHKRGTKQVILHNGLEVHKQPGIHKMAGCQ